MAEAIRPAAVSPPSRKYRHPHMDAPELSPLTQSRETGEMVPEAHRKGEKPATEKKGWAHFVAGGIGGMTAAVLTAPLDVLKTRLQSDFYQQRLRASRAAAAREGLHPAHAALHHLRETMQILGSVYRLEGWRALFKGLGPNLVGVVPARAINFFTYGNSKWLLTDHVNGGQEAAWIHLTSGVLAGVATSTATNPIWLVKTRLQLDKELVEEGQKGTRKYRNSVDCIRQVLRNEGFTGLYKGMSASYLGVAESTLQWVLYEQMKKSLAKRDERRARSGREMSAVDHALAWTGHGGAAGFAKLIATVLTYPHEVARTRLRQAPMDNGRPKYTGLVQCFKVIWKEEGMIGMYGGMTPHLMRTVPSAAIMFGMYEGLLRVFGEKA